MSLPPNERDQKIRRAIPRGVYSFTRQSTLEQTVVNTGSSSFQDNQWVHLLRFGVTKEHVTFIEGDGESGTAGKHRIKFRDLCDAVSSGKVGILLVARLDRLGRNSADSERLFAALEATGCLLLVDGQLLDMANHIDRLLAGLLGQFAQFENRQRASWMQNARVMLAMERKALFRLPSGMVWASPQDPQFVQRMTIAGLESWLTPFVGGVAPEYDVIVSRDGKRIYPFPFPDRDVFSSVRLRLDWIQREQSVARVFQLIRHSPDWPDGRSGQIPITDGLRWTVNSAVRWRAATRLKVRNWLASPALYGIYSYSSSAATNLQALGESSAEA
jgi:DNA invertase Pin-like site-specific DNA recombinase